MKYMILATLCALLFIIPLGATKIQNYGAFKKEFDKAFNEKKDTGFLVELLTKFTEPELLKSFVLKNEFYKDIFVPLLNFLLTKNMISLVHTIVEKIPNLSDKEQEFVVKNFAKSFNYLFKELEGVNEQEFDLATELFYSVLGNKILVEWLKLDPKLPFVQGKLIDSKNRESSLNIMQQMLQEYSVSLAFKGSYGSIKKPSYNVAIDKETIDAFIKAWNKGNEKEKAFVAHINGSRKGNAFLAGRHAWEGDYTTPELAKAIKLGYLFEKPEVKGPEDSVDQFARACYSIALE